VDDGGEIKPKVRLVQQTAYCEKYITFYRQVSRWLERYRQESPGTDGERAKLKALRQKSGRNDSARRYVPKYPKPVGWTHRNKPVLGPGIVLDPFGGTGTTGEVAVLLGRRFVGIDLYEGNVARMNRRCEEAFEALQRAREAA
jgi:hypothetical protein